MGVRIKGSETYKTQVNFEVLTEAGKKENCNFEAVFKRMSRSEIADVMAECKNDSEMCRRVLVGWKMTRLDTGEDWPFNEENLTEFLNEAGYAGMTILRFMETVGASREKSEGRR